MPCCVYVGLPLSNQWPFWNILDSDLAQCPEQIQIMTPEHSWAPVELSCRQEQTMTSSYSCCSLLASNPGSYVLLIQVLLKPRTSEVSSLSSNLGLQELHSSSHGHLPFFFFFITISKNIPKCKQAFYCRSNTGATGQFKTSISFNEVFWKPIIHHQNLQRSIFS